MKIAATWAATWSVEQLEKRTLLSGGVFDVSKIPVYVATSGDISDPTHGPLGNAGATLTQVYSDYRRFINRGGKPSKFTDKPLTLLQTQGTSVAVTVRTRGSMAATTTLLHGLGAELIYRDNTYDAVDAWVPVAQLSTLAQTAIVANINPVFKPSVDQQGIAPNQGDDAENADALRSTFGLDGTGVKVGVLSDSVNQFEHGLADSVATGDLPPGVQIIQDGAGGTDEGRAMLEEIHDIAPGATLAFATAGPTPEVFAHNITELVRAGCKVIVDDVGFDDEPAFQSGIIDQAIIDAVENHGVAYFSAAGNASSGGYLNTSPHWVTDINHRTLLDFDPTDAVSTRMSITVNGDASVNLQWDNPYNGVVGAATVDLDISFIDPVSGQIVAQSSDQNLATSSPIDFVDVPPGTYDVEISVSDLAPGATLPTVVRFSSEQIGGNTPPFTNLQFPSAQVSTQGHSAGQDTISVGAVGFFDAPPYNSGGPISSEPYSAIGPSISVFTANGQRRAKPLTLLKPDLSGIDGINTSFFEGRRGANHTKNGLPDFYGTSAAAPNVAAVAALLFELNASATPTDIKNALISSAKQNPVNGQKPGTWDPQAGFGLIDGLEAGALLDPNFVVADIGRTVPDSVTRGPDVITITFSEPVIGFSISDLILTRGKNSTTNLLVGTGAKLTTDDEQTFNLKNLAAITAKRGTYFLNFHPVGVLDAKTQTHPAIQGATSFFVNGKPTGLAAIPVSGTEIDLSWTDNTSNDSGFVVTRALDADFTLGVQTFTTKPNVSHLKDTTGLTPTTQYFYKVRAIVNDGAPNPSTDSVNAFTLADNENVADNRNLSTTVVGAWTLTPDSVNSIGGDYLVATTAGNKNVTFTPDLSADGTYFLYVHSVAAKGNATNAEVELLSDGDVKKTFTVNEQTKNGYVFLGSFKLPQGTATSVRVTNSGANGTVVADAVRFQRTSTSAAGLTVSASSSASLFNTAGVVKSKNVDDLVA